MPSVPNTAESYLQMCHTLMDAAEDGGEAGEVKTPQGTDVKLFTTSHGPYEVH